MVKRGRTGAIVPRVGIRPVVEHRPGSLGAPVKRLTDLALGGLRQELRILREEAVDLVHDAAGTTAIREGSRLERAFRDMYTGTQHAFISEKVYIDCANVLLGLTEHNPGL